MMQIKTLLDDQNFLEFMITAKQNTYALGGEAKALRLSHGGKLYTFNDERWPQWRYVDEWQGNGPLENPFFGRETYLERADAHGPFTHIAQMAYSSYARGTEDEIKQMFGFLGRMLRRVSLQSLFRGPSDSVVSEDDMQYNCRWIRQDPFRASGREGIQIFSGQEDQEDTVFYVLNFLFCCLR